MNASFGYLASAATIATRLRLCVVLIFGRDEPRRQARHAGCRQHRQADRHELRRGGEGAIAAIGVLVEEGDGDLEFTARREALEETGRDDDDGGGNADLRIGGTDADDEAAEADHEDGDGERQAAAEFVGERREHEGADRAADEADGEGREAGDERGGRIAGGKHLAGEDSGEKAVDRPVVPFDEMADGAAADRLQAAGRHARS